MSWIGKLLGGGLGFVVGGPIGAVLGMVIGHQAFDSGAGGVAGINRLEAKQTIYFTAVFSMLGKLAKADGVVSQHEIDIVDRVMRDNFRLAAEARQLAIRIFNAAKDSDDKFEDFARQLYREFGDTPEVLVSIVDLLMVVAHADHEMHAEEEAMIRAAVEIFRIEDQFRQIKARYGGVPDDVARYYGILGCEVGDSLAAVKKKYRKLAMEYHPDRVQSRGMAPEFTDAALEKFKEIQHALDVVERDIKHRAE